MNTTNSYQKFDLGLSDNLTITNDDAANAIAISNDGTNLIGLLYAGESLTFREVGKCQDLTVYLKANVNNAFSKFRLWGW